MNCFSLNKLTKINFLLIRVRMDNMAHNIVHGQFTKADHLSKNSSYVPHKLYMWSPTTVWRETQDFGITELLDEWSCIHQSFTVQRLKPQIVRHQTNGAGMVSTARNSFFPCCHYFWITTTPFSSAYSPPQSQQVGWRLV